MMCRAFAAGVADGPPLLVVYGHIYGAYTVIIWGPTDLYARRYLVLTIGALLAWKAFSADGSMMVRAFPTGGADGAVLWPIYGGIYEDVVVIIWRQTELSA